MALEPVRRTLANGVTLVAKETRTTPAVTILAGIRAGAFYDPAGREGTAALVARVLDRGTEHRSAEAIADELDGRGASLSVIAGRHQITVSATCLAEDFEAIYALLADIVRRPTFDEREVLTRRAELLTSILQDEDDPGAVAIDHLMSRLYPQHPYGRRARGTANTVDQLRRHDLQVFHETWFDPAHTILVVVGDVDAGRVLEASAREFEPWRSAPRDEMPLPPAIPPMTRQLFAAPMMNKAQADVAYGFVGMNRADPDYYAAWVMNNALGQYALGGRLGDSIRERQGMAYYVYSTLDASLAPGPFMIRAGVAGANVERTLESIDREIQQLLEQGLTEKELDESKRYLVGSIPRQLETNAGIAGFLLSVEFYSLGADYDVRLPGLLSGVTLPAANQAAERLLSPDRATIVVAGPWSAAGSSDVVIVSASESTTQAALVPSNTPKTQVRPIE